MDTRLSQGAPPVSQTPARIEPAPLRAAVHARADHGAVQTPWPELRGNFPVALLLGGEGLAKGQRPPDPMAPPPRSLAR